MMLLPFLFATRLLMTVDDPAVAESSGLAESKRFPGAWWTHNDSGSAATLYLIGGGRVRGSVSLRGVRAVDCEGLAVSPGGYLYLGDIGDNSRRRSSIAVYRFREPARLGGEIQPELFRLRYPDGPKDAEALLLHPHSGDLYIVTKAFRDETRTIVYRAKAPLRSDQELARVAILRFPGESDVSLLAGRITGGDISPDGKRVILCDYFRGWEYTLPRGSRDFDAIWAMTPAAIDLGRRLQGEAVAYRNDGRAVVTSSEGRPFSLTETTLRD